MKQQVLVGMMIVAATTGAVAANDRAVRYEFGDRADVRIVTDVVATEAGVAQWRHRLSEGSHPEEARAIDRASGKPLATRIDGSDLLVELGRALPANAQQRLRIEEVASRSDYVKGQGLGAALVFEHVVEGRITLALPPGYGVTACSIPAQYAIEEGRLEVGILAIDRPTAVKLEAAVRPSAPRATLTGSFRVGDDRTIVYWLEDPGAQRISLALEMLITQPGQAHVYSVLRKEDNITNPRTVDLDRGIELPTRIVTGREAMAIGDSPAPIPEDASVLVADLGYSVPPGGSARVRLHQVATDKEGYHLSPEGELRWTRFLARLRTRAVLPKGWSLTSVDQPAVISTDAEGRVVLDFLQAGANSPALYITARMSRSGM
jgi:hypothetical protein